MRLLEKLWFRAKTGASIEDLGTIKEQVVIRYKNLYINLLIDENDEIASLGWSDDAGMFSEVPIRDFWTASAPVRSTPPKKELL